MVTSNLPQGPDNLDIPASARTATARENARLDGALVRRFKQDGDEGAFVEIVERYRSKIFSIAFAALHNHFDAEEVAQDTFIRAHRGLAAFRGDCSLATWMHRIALNLSRNRYWYYFRRRRHLTQSLDTPLSPDSDATLANRVESAEPGPVGDAVLNEHAQLIEKCLARLSPCQSSILQRRSAQNDSYVSIAASLGINIGTVKSRIARARSRLRAELVLACPELVSAAAPGEWFAPDHASTRFSVL